MFALQHGGEALFSRDCMYKVDDILVAKGLHLDRTTYAYSAVHGRLDPSLHDILRDIMGLSTLFNCHLDKRPLDLIGYQEALQSICYRLLQFSSLRGSRLKPGLQAAHHIGMTIFMMTIFLQYDRRRIIKYELVWSCVRDVLDSGCLDEHEDELAFWLLMLGGIWVSCDGNDDWLVSNLQQMGQKLGMETWAEVRNMLAKFPWIDVIHNEPGRKLWNRLCCTGYASE